MKVVGRRAGRPQEKVLGTVRMISSWDGDILTPFRMSAFSNWFPLVSRMYASPAREYRVG